MASLLRSGKFVRYFSSITRNLVFNNGNRGDPETLLCAKRAEWEIKIHRSLASAQLPQRNLNDHDSTISSRSVDKMLVQADEDLKRIGRLTRNNIQNILSEIKNIKTATPQQCALMIRCCGSLVPEEHPQARTDLAHEIWKTFENLGIPLDISHYNALLKVYLDNEHKFNPLEFLDQISHKNIEPNRVTYQRLIAAFCQKGDINGASQILEKMKEKSLPINENIFNSLIMGHSRLGDHENARGILSLMKRSGLEPDTESYLALLCGYAQSGMLSGITSTLDECKLNDVSMYDRHLLEVLYTAALHGHIPIVEFILENMEKDSGFNSDCVNVALRLVAQNQEDVAFRLVQAMKPAVRTENRNSAVPGAFFIRQLIKCRRPADKIMHFCDQLAQQNTRIYFVALSSANEHNYGQVTTETLKRIKDQKETLSPRFFWPLLETQSKTAGEAGVLDLLRKMVALEVTPNMETINEHVLPYLSDPKSIKENIRKLQSAGIPARVVAVSLLLNCLNRNDLKAANMVASIYFVRPKETIWKAAARAYVATGDAQSFVDLLRKIALGLVDREEPKEESEPVVKDRKSKTAEIVGPFVREVVEIATKPSAELVHSLLAAVHDAGLVLSNETVEAIQNRLDTEMTDSIADLLAKLISGESFSLEQIAVEEKDVSQGSGDRNRFNQLIRDRNLDEALELKRQMETKNVKLTIGMQIQLMDLMVYRNQIDQAWEAYTQIFLEEPTAEMNPLKTLYLAAALLNAGRTDDCFTVLSRLRPFQNEDVSAKLKASLNNSAWRMLNLATEKGDLELAKKLVVLFQDSKAVEMNAFLLGPLVKYHLNKNDLDSAIEEFENLVNTHRCTPSRGLLMSHLIEKEDATRLQRVMDLNIKVHGESNSLYDLVFSFLECGRVRQAKKVIETPGLRARRQRLEMACQRYLEENRITELANLVKITSGLFDVDRHMLYDYLLTAYIKQKDVDSALGLWTQMQEEDHRPKDEFLAKLGSFLKENNREPPFVVPNIEPIVPQPEPKATIESSTQTDKKASSPSKSSLIKRFQKAVQEEDVQEALRIKKELASHGSDPNVTESSRLLRLLATKDELEAATSLLTEMLEKKKYPRIPVFRYYLHKLVEAGERETLDRIGNLMDENIKRQVSFDGVSRAISSQDATSASAFLDRVIEKTDQIATVKDEEQKLTAVKSLVEECTSSNLAYILRLNPHLEEKCKILAEKSKALGLVSPLNALWMHYMISGRGQDANSAWNILKTHSGRIQFKPICHHIRSENSTELGRQLIDTLASSQFVLKSALGLAYSVYLDALCNKGQQEEALATLREALSKDVKLEDLNAGALKNLKRCLESSGLTFPYAIPARQRKSAQHSSTSSDSD